MRILAVPLARQRSTATTYFTYLVHAAPAALSEKAPKAQASLMQRIINRASDFWVNLGRTDVSSTLNWRRRTYLLGERIMDRIEYEEWALKGIDQGMGPALKELMEHEANKRPAVPLKLEYPNELVSESEVMKSLNELAKKREPHHYRLLAYNMVGIPITAPLFLVPVLPNFVTYYLMWRAWSHWRAYIASHALNVLLKRKLIEPVPSTQFDTAFQEVQGTKETDLTDWDVYLHADQIAPLVRAFDLSTQARIDLRRAQEQLTMFMQRGQKSQT